MKKFLLVLAVFGLVGLSAYATTYTNSIGQVVTFTAGENGVTIYSVSNTGNTNLLAVTRAPAYGALLDTAVTIDTTDYTPAGLGDILIGLYSNVVFVACGTTTNDWAQLN